MTRKVDHGTPEIRNRGKKVEVAADNSVGGATCLVDEWATYPRFLRELDLITPDQFDAAEGFIALYERTHVFTGGGTSGNGELFQRWIDFGRRVGGERLAVLNEICLEKQAPCAPPLEAEMWAARKAMQTAEKAGENELAEHIRQSVLRLENLKVIRNAQIAAHRTLVRLNHKRIADALDAAADALQKGEKK